MRKLTIYFLGLIMLFVAQSCVFSDVDEQITVKGVVTTMPEEWPIPLEGVEVKVTNMSDVDAVAVTNAKGEYTLKFKGSGTAMLTFDKYGFAKLNTYTSFMGGTTSRVDAELFTYQEELERIISNKNHLVYAATGVKDIEYKTSSIDWQPISDKNWLSAEKVKVGTKHYLRLKWEENKTTDKRPAVVTISGPEGSSFPINVIQAEGPVLELLDYTGKDGNSNFENDGLFLVFNREVLPLELFLTPKPETVNYVMLSDNTTIAFQGLEMPAGNVFKLEYKVKSMDGYELSGTINLK